MGHGFDEVGRRNELQDGKAARDQSVLEVEMSKSVVSDAIALPDPIAQRCVNRVHASSLDEGHRFLQSGTSLFASPVVDGDLSQVVQVDR